MYVYMYALINVEKTPILEDMNFHLFVWCLDMLQILGSILCHILLLVLTLQSALTAYGFAAYALGDPSVTVEEVTPPVFTTGPLLPSEVGFP